MTNAHVVAGVHHPTVLVGDQAVTGTVVYYNPNVDIAVLEVPGVHAPYLHFSTHGQSREVAAVLGYPEDGPYNVQPARIRSEQRLRSPDIYGNGAVIRSVYSLRALVRPGNSGGPLVSSAGRVLGVVFAASVTNHDTGYALTADEVSQGAAAGLSSNHRVSTGACA